MATTSTTREQINLRASADQRSTIDRAAAIKGLTRTDFILSAAMHEAENVILDQVYFKLTPEQYDCFVELLDNPPEPTDELKQLMREVAARQ